MPGPASLTNLESITQKYAWLTYLAGMALLLGLVWIIYAWRNQRPYIPQAPSEPARQLVPGTVASMDSPPISYSEGWAASQAGADPSEPENPWAQPSGVLTFPYTGTDLALNLGVGDYWAYLYVTVDGQPANRLPNIRGNTDSAGNPAGYRTFYEPGHTSFGQPVSQWVAVHQAVDSDAPHVVRVEVWRGWGQTPLRGIAVDAMPARSPPLWPGAAITLLGALVLISPALAAANRGLRAGLARRIRRPLRRLLLPGLSDRTRLLLAGFFFLIAAAGVILVSWLPTLLGLAGLAIVALARPAIWTAATLFSLPFYFSFDAQILPNRALGLIDVFVLSGVLLVTANWFLSAEEPSPASHGERSAHQPRAILVLLAALVAWAFVAVFASEHMDVALYEWRTVFLYAGLFAVLLWRSLYARNSRRGDLWLVVVAWTTGGVTIAAIGLVQYFAGTMLITAEGVSRIRAYYGSPNNLALYLERTFIFTLALAAFLPATRMRMAWAVGAAVQALALVLTFSKGALLLGIPAGLTVLWLGGLVLLPLYGRSRRPLIWVALAALGIVVALVPFLNTERFQRLLDVSQGTGYLRLLLWRSSWQMALDHPLLGVGPDNFLYAYRSNYLLPDAWQEPNLNHPHNWVLDWWTRIGLPGLVASVALFAVGFRALWKASVDAARRQREEAFLSLGFLAAGVAALAHGLIDASFALPDLMIVWVLILVAGIALTEHQEVGSGSDQSLSPVRDF